jgi:pyrroline-5-carboxylate reductase
MEETKHLTTIDPNVAELSRQHLAFIGGGVMAEAMVAGLLERKLVAPESIWISHPRSHRTAQLAERFGVHVTTSNREAALAAQIVVLCVKPQRLSPVLNELKGKLDTGKLLVSIVTGASLNNIATRLLHEAVVRTMPNTPAQIGQGLTVWAATPAVTEHQRELVRALLGALGRELYFEEEKFVDMATAISGSGPSYVFLLMEAMIDAAVHLGFSRQDARELVTATLLGSVLFAQESQKHPAELRNMVTSPNGTSAEALYQLEKGGVRTVISKAIYAAYQKTGVLSEMINK